MNYKLKTRTKYKIRLWYPIKYWIMWRFFATYKIIQHHCKNDQNYSLRWYSKIWVSFKCWVAVMFGRRVKDDHFPEGTPKHQIWYPDGIEVAYYGEQTYYSPEYGKCQDWTELRYIDVKGVRLRFTTIHQSHP
jgi:hypothetical protein